MLPIESVWAVHAPAFSNLIESIRLGIVAGIDFELRDAAAGGAPTYQKANGVAVIPIRGVMNRYFDWGSWMVSTARLTREVQAAHADKSVHAIVLQIDSPGGSVSGLPELGDAVRAAAQDKPVTAQVEGMAASAAYYTAANASRIVGGRTDMVGSIGTRIMLYDFSAMFEKQGIKAIPVDTGKFKSAGAMGTEITDEQKADFQRIVDAFQSDFRQVVSNGRQMNTAQLDAVADGRVWQVSEGIDLGLVDGVSTLSETINSQRRVGFSAATARAQLETLG